ncbi:MAG TPA: hypothetical protein VGX94_11760 [Terriglobia bacterium]|nr:hypothetical protein [Terriglobia bacterium]
MFDYSNGAANLTASSNALPSSSGLSAVEENFTKVALALNQHSKAVVGLREQLHMIQNEVDQLSRAVNALHERLAKTDGVDAAAPGAGSQASAFLREQIAKLDASCASNFDLLSKATTAAHEKLAKFNQELDELRPQMAALKVHAESFPQALRAARRSDAETQEALKAFDARLRKLESRSSKTKAQS